jgi:DNA uptake protein ComE-like DNA-binding protein
VKFTKTVEMDEHPYEDIFDLPKGTTETTHVIAAETPMVEHEQYDGKDKEIEQQFQDVYQMAVTAFADQAGLLKQMDDKQVARNMEVANGFLNTALAAAKEKAKLKHDKDSSRTKTSGTPNNVTVTNNTAIYADRNDILDMYRNNPEMLKDINPPPTKT